MMWQMQRLQLDQRAIRFGKHCLLKSGVEQNFVLRCVTTGFELFPRYVECNLVPVVQRVHLAAVMVTSIACGFDSTKVEMKSHSFGPTRGFGDGEL